MKRMKNESLLSAAGSVLFGLALTACASAPPPAPVPPPAPSATPTPPPPLPAATREQPPAPLAAKTSAFPAIAKQTLANGLRISVVEAHALPVIEVRVVVHAGMGFGTPGTAEITAEMLKEGGTRAHSSSEIVKRVETLGSSLGVGVEEDATELSMSVVRGQLGDAMDVLAEVVRTPRFDAVELTRTKTRMTDEAQDNARSNGSWAATRLLFQKLYPASSPYAVYDAIPSEIAKVDGAKIRDFHKRFYVPSNVEVVVAGDVDGKSVGAAVEKAFGDWKAVGAAPKVEFPAPTPPDAPHVIVANRPESVQSDVIVTQLFSERRAADWPVDRVALQIFGGGMTGRLFLDVREKRSLAYRADAHYLELAHDAQPLFAYAGTQAAKTADAVQGLLDNLAGMRATPPADDEVATARRYLSDSLAVKMETVSAIATMVAQLRELDLPDDYWETYRAALRAVSTSEAVAQSAKVFSPDHVLIVVAGDANVVAPSLTRFGDVTVVDSEHDFRVVRTLPKAAPGADGAAAPAGSR